MSFYNAKKRCVVAFYFMHSESVQICDKTNILKLEPFQLKSPPLILKNVYDDSFSDAVTTIQ